MYFLVNIALAMILSLFSTEATAQGEAPPHGASCRRGTINIAPNAPWSRGTDCVLKPKNVYFCGTTTVVHKQNRLILRAPQVDSAVMVSCQGWVFLFHCRANDWGTFYEALCKDKVQSVSNVIEYI
ncbi:hypothetical protein EG327_007201 [Venturia inaequalis]|uniref:Uncharacterized protein n=1 Tax=Venturia inaequalis TaxID=5025 RepID=A0A8H3YYK6_VENIN|nr:hypothetical protein EG327_007201 [Venturia inaequalis]